MHGVTGLHSVTDLHGEALEYSSAESYPALAVLRPFQDPEVPAGETPPPDVSLLEQIAAEPALVQLILLVLGGLSLWLVLIRMSRSVREARGRAAMKDYLLGVEQALHGDVKGAAKRLERVLAEDPENIVARLYFARVLAELGEPGEAHKHHVQLVRGFGIRSRRNQIALAESLLDIGRAADAVEPAQHAVQGHPDDLDAQRVLVRALIAAGRPEEAGVAAERLAVLLPDGEERTRIREQGARAFALAAKTKLRSGDNAAARKLLAAGARVGGGAPEVYRASLQLEWLEHGDAAFATDGATRALGSTLTAPAGDPVDPRQSEFAIVARDVAGSAPLVGPRATLARIAPVEPYSCGACDAPLAEPLEICPLCGVEGRVEAREPDLLDDIDSPSQVVDAIEQNRAHIQRLLDRVERGGDVEAAEEAILAIGGPAVGEVLARAVEAGADDAVFIPLIQRMGPAIVPDLFAAYTKRKADWLARFGERLGRRSAATVVGRIVQAFGRDALADFEPLLDSADRDLRKVLIDFYIGLADQAEFQKVLEAFPPVEIVRRLDQTPAELLQRFVATVEDGSFQAEVLLVEPGFTRDVDLFVAATRSEAGAVLEDVIRRRGGSRALTAVLIDSLDDPVAAPAASRLLDAFGAVVRDAQIVAFADMDTRETVRSQLRDRLVRSVDDALVGRLCDGFGASPTQLDDELVALFAAMGDPAVEGIVRAYEQGSVLEKFAGALVSRHSHRRRMLVRALQSIGSTAARDAIAALRRSETDSNLKLRLDQALHRIREQDEGAARDAPAADDAQDGADQGRVDQDRVDQDRVDQDRGGHGQAG